MARDWLDIADTMTKRREARGPLLDTMMAVRERYNGDWVLPELGGDTTPLIPTIIADAIDNNGLRAASVTPDIVAPAMDAAAPRSRQAAERRRKAWLYTWEKSELNLHLRRAYRHLFGYATSVLAVEPDFEYSCPKIAVKDPLHCFPEPKSAEDLTPPRDCGFIYGKSAEWIRYHYPNAPGWIEPRRQFTGDVWDMVEWIDDEHVVIGVLGPRWADGSYTWDTGNLQPVELKRWPNRTGRCTVVTPQRLTLDKIHSQVAKIVGHADLEARLLYLDILATQKSIVPDRFILGTSAMIPRLVGGSWKDGSTGEVNIILDATAPPGELRGTPDPNNKITQDRLERNARVSTGQTPIMQGEAFGSARTGRGIDAMLAAAVDPRIQEAQEIMQARLTDVNRVVADCYLGYWEQKKYTVFSGWTTDPALTEFTPATTFTETTENKVAYPLPGTDIVGLNVVVGQLAGSELASKRSARTMHPFIKDPDAEEQQVLVEKLQAALEMKILTSASDPSSQMTGSDIAFMIQRVRKGDDLAAAELAAQEEAQKRQARMAQAVPEGMAAPPETMPGMENPGTGAEAQLPPTVPGPQEGLANLDRLMGALVAPAVPR